ncbi:MAG: NAD-dependent dehydratase [Elusimicrobia bacterium RIFCSPLOWO2_02_FULL_39_32]|nr:MAG: NAD-dependent dehydratase [Elusimicrobia bacterium RIFCSPHIGHO2_02_FULL_39_36]OGR92852.1 MAG: NAD-dependent dehydratase [Elusimicrobia bacterium RIFCSPLOWO2_02_FULL_39_32]OGR99637.1 MAG: NAD-dependent dehydratase [Elusimicrobia bacterium RIFCSPLOWO2_12_FULL_39_28]
MKTLVTGGAGFIGSHLIDRLISEGHSVTVLDNFSTGRIKNLDHHKDNPNLQIHNADISSFEKIEKFFKGIEWVFHIAALADIVPSIQTPLNYHKSNVGGTVSVLEAARKYEIKKIIYAASSSCYGIPTVYPTPETSPIQPQYPYALTKNLGEQILMHWGNVYKLPVISLRFFNVFGPRSRTTGTYGAVFGVFLAQKLSGQPFTVVGDGTQTRDFTFVSDVVDACIVAAQSKLQQEIFNVGSGRAVSVNHLVELLGGPVIYIPKRPGEPDCTQADISKIKNILNWKPKVSFEQGVPILLKNILDWKEAPVWTKETIQEATKEWFQYLSVKA